MIASGTATLRFSRLSALVLLTVVVSACGGSSGRRADVSAAAMPTGGNFTGVWHSPQYGEMHLVQNSTTVIGEYEKNHRRGRLQGGVTGNLLKFYWEEERELVQGRTSKTNGRGYFQYALGDDGKHYIQGAWGIDHDEVGGGQWNAYRLQNRSPVLKQGGRSDQDRAEPEQIEDYSDSDTDDTGGAEPAGGDAFDGVL